MTAASSVQAISRSGLPIPHTVTTYRYTPQVFPPEGRTGPSDHDDDVDNNGDGVGDDDGDIDGYGDGDGVGVGNGKGDDQLTIFVMMSWKVICLHINM